MTSASAADFLPGALAAWQPPRASQRGRPRGYSDAAIETGHLLRSVNALLGIGVGVPDHTTFSRRSPGLAFAALLAHAQASGPVHVVIDATGLKVYGAGEWLVEKRGGRGTRTWRKLHFAVDPSSGNVPLQGHHRQQPSRPDPACPEDRERSPARR